MRVPARSSQGGSSAASDVYKRLRRATVAVACAASASSMRCIIAMRTPSAAIAPLPRSAASAHKQAGLFLHGCNLSQMQFKMHLCTLRHMLVYKRIDDAEWANTGIGVLKSRHPSSASALWLSPIWEHFHIPLLYIPLSTLLAWAPLRLAHRAPNIQDALNESRCRRRLGVWS